MKRTRKWTFVAQEAQRLAMAGVHPQEIADKLEVDRSTITRWTQQGKLAFKKSDRTIPGVASGQTPAEWAAAVRAAFALDPTDEQLVILAEAALTLAATGGASVRLQAMGRFQAIVRQLALVARQTGAEAPTPAAEPERKKNPVAQRSGGDPRAVLMAVK
jgi:hypothetical protein